jgi:hypothetical protein
LDDVVLMYILVLQWRHTLLFSYYQPIGSEVFQP